MILVCLYILFVENYDFEIAMMGLGVPMMAEVADFADDGSMNKAAMAESPGSDVVSSTDNGDSKIRTEFPETWLWSDYVTE